MTVGANSYGTVADVAALTPMPLIGGTFTTMTTPTLAQVEGWINSASATLNICLAKVGFHVPLSQADAVAACAQIVVESVSEMVRYVNSTGRFYTDRALEHGVAPMKVLRQEMADWVTSMAPGLEKSGAARDISQLGSILVKDVGADGNAVQPIFQRGNFGNNFASTHGGKDGDTW